MVAQRFFMQLLPVFVADKLFAFNSLRGKIAVTVEGEGAWTICLGDTEWPVVEGARDADLALTFAQEAFAAFVKGTLDVGQALTDGAVSVVGKFELLEVLGMLLAPKSSALDVRLSR